MTEKNFSPHALDDTTQPAGQRIEDKVEYAKHILALYAPELLHTST